MWSQSRTKLWMIALTLHFSGAHIVAETIGPLLYHDATDSPFNLSGLGVDFFLEDFSRGIELIPRDPAAPHFSDRIAKFSTPGVYETSGRVSLLPDGKLHALSKFANFSANEVVVELSFEFAPQELGQLPQAVGFVASNASPLTVSFYGPTGTLVETLTAPVAPLPDPIPRLGGLEDTIEFYRRDRFFGAIHPAGISRVEFLSPARNAMIDDFQYGQLIPEPAGVLLAGIGWMAALAALRRRSRSIAPLVSPRCARVVHDPSSRSDNGPAVHGG
jgi:hypothetical protein